MDKKEAAKQLLIKLRDRIQKDRNMLLNNPKELGKLRRLGINPYSKSLSTHITQEEVELLIDFFNEFSGESDGHD